MTLEELKESNNEEGPSLQTKLENICTSLDDPNKPSRPFSAQYYDREGKPIFFYFGSRWLDDKARLHNLC